LRKFLTVLFLFCVFGMARAQGTYTAASCNTADVNAVINGPTHNAVNGDTIVIPAGNCTWTSGIAISGVGISILGSGTPNTGPSTFGAGTSTTVISSNISGGASALFNVSGLSYGQFTRISLINFASETNTNPTTGVGALIFSGTCTTSGCANLRLDNLTFGPTWNGAYLPAGSIVFTFGMTGVADHNSINGPDGQAPYFINANQGSWQGVGQYGDNSWYAPDTMGTAQAMYFENNVFDSGTASEGDFGETVAGGGRYVCRFNKFSDVATEAVSCGGHGTSSGGRPRGMRQMEAYGNTMVCTSSAGCEGPLSFNSGTGYVFGNNWSSTGSGFFNGYSSINAQRSAGTGWPIPWNDCDGTGPYDLNSGGSAVACIDQPGRGTATVLLSGFTPSPTGWVGEPIAPIYEFTDTVTGGFTTPMFTGSSTLAANRDFYYEGTNQAAQTSTSVPFNGSTGTGHGALAMMPTTCTTGVGYFATDQGSWNTSGNGFGQGVFYKCTSTNTWNVAYTPYTYPHPLTAAASNVYTAASAAYTDVNAVINGPTHVAVNGDIIQIPCSGNVYVTWTNTLTISASITLTALGASPNSGPSTVGAGTNCLTIIDDVTSGWMFYLTPTYAAANNVTTLQNFNIDPISTTTALYTPITMEGTGTSSGMPQVRIDNIVFGKATPWSGATNSSNATRMLNVDNVVGVADHNTIAPGNNVYFYEGQMSSYLGVGQLGDNSWAQPDSMGGANNWFTENNVFNTTGNASYNDCTEGGPSVSESGGCRVVNRFNNIVTSNSFQITSVHGLDTTGRVRSARHTETYGNTESCSGNCQDLATFRGGTGMVWGNKAVNVNPGGSYWNQIFDLTTYRLVFNSNPWGYCGGLTSLDPFDTVDNTVYYSGTMSASNGSLTMTDSSKSFPNLIPLGMPYSVYDTTQGFVSQVVSNTATTITVMGNIPESSWTGFNNGDGYQIIRATVCMDQSGRGQGNLISGSTPTPSAPINEALDPIYEWNDSFPVGTLAQQVLQNPKQTIANRDYYTDNWKGGGNSAPVLQTSNTVPFNGSTTCNAGSGNYSCGVGVGTLANIPTSCTTGVAYWAMDQGSWNHGCGNGAQGVLYKCTSTNSWNVGYTPYTCPHPLAGGTPQASVPSINPATGTYSSSQTVTMACASPSPTIYYTINGSVPTTSSTVYSGSFNVTSTTNVQAICTASGYTQSNTAQSIITIGTPQTATPVVSPATGTYPRAQTVTITDATGGSTIYYTTNGTTPTTGSTQYTGSFALSTTANVQAIAVASGYSQSAVGSSNITITSAITIDGGGTAHCFAVGTSCATGTAVAGDAILVDASDRNGTITSISDGTNTYHQLSYVQDAANPAWGGQWVACNVAAGTYTVTVNGTGGAYEWVNVHAKVLANTLANSVCYDTGPVTQTSVSTSSTPTCGSVQAPTGNSEWVEAYLVPDGAFASSTAGANYTILDAVLGGVNNSAIPEYWNQTTATATNGPQTIASSVDYLNVCTAILPVAAVTPTCAIPTQLGPPYSYSGNGPGPGGAYYVPPAVSVGFNSATPGCTLHATFNGTTASCASPVYGGTSSLTATTPISTIACGAGFNPSANSGGVWDIINTVAATPTLSPITGTYGSAQTVTISDTTPSSTIYYTTNGNIPTTSSAVYTASLTVSSNTVVNAIAAASGYANSAVGSATYTILAATPAFSPAGGMYATSQVVTITTTTPSATIYYTTNGSTPTTSSAVYTTPLTVSSSQTLRAITVATNYAQSAVGNATYTIGTVVATPSLSPASGSYTSAQTVTITDGTIGSTIYYTTNGTVPTTASTVYTAPFTVSVTSTVNAIATASGYVQSAVGSATYTIATPAATPTFSPVAGTYGSAQTVTISDTTPSPTIHYTTDGSTPTTSSPVYSTPLTIASTATVKAIATASGYTQSAVGTALYTINSTPAPPTLTGGTTTMGGSANHN
jgi:hypothetical protein